MKVSKFTRLINEIINILINSLIFVIFISFQDTESILWIHIESDVNRTTHYNQSENGFAIINTK